MNRKIYPPVGFHGDYYLMQGAAYLLKNTLVFVETGTNIGATLHYVAGNHPSLLCYSCEADEKQFARAKQNCAGMNNVRLYHATSQQFLPKLLPKLDVYSAVFWLDAHGRGFQWPLRDEVRMICKHVGDRSWFILIDDFQVPGKKQFQFDRYNNQVCSYAYIKDCCTVPHTVVYPSYEEKTSPYHPLVGWGLLELNKTESPFVRKFPSWSRQA